MVTDAVRHWNNGLNFLDPGYLNGFDPVVYQIYVFAIQTLTGSDPRWLAVVAGILSVATTCCFLQAALAWRIEKSLAIWFAVVIAWLPSLAIIFHFYMTESLMLFFTAVALWASGNAWHSKTRIAFGIAVALWCIAALTKLTVAPAGLILLFCIWLRTDNRQQTFLIGLIVSIGLILPNAIRSEQILGYYAPFGTASLMQKVYRKADTQHVDFDRGDTFSYFTAPSLYSYPLAPLSDWQISRTGGHTVSIKINPKTERQDWENAASQYPTTIEQRLEDTFENAVVFLFDPSWPDSDTTTWPGVINYWLRWIWLPLIIFVSAGFLLQLRKTPRLPSPVIMATVGLTLFLMFQQTAVMEGRFRKAVEPMLILSAFLVFQWLLDKTRSLQGK